MGVKIKLTNNAEKLKRGTPTSTGLDLKSLKEYTLKPMERVLVETGIHIEPEKPYEVEGGYIIPDIQIRPRSGLSSKGIIVWLGSGDEDYRGEYKVSIMNLSGEEYKINIGDKVAQLVFGFASIPNIEYVTELDDNTVRGTGGFGSTDK